MSRLDFDLAWAKDKSRKRVYVLRATDCKDRVVPTKKRGLEILRTWRRWCELAGWKVRSSPTGYIASSPSGEKRAAVVRAHDPHTLERLD